ncbi:hypothetical protein SELMODRAFT_113974 [Selaginella moellendorffii]|uniref:Pentacotripeptide-repeat region of PRORP domain-containing protein n=1 Tax=Selaginella moellendorffii TaxID=88036 RepID=D8SD02_SELML|nr:hypothetical protein SELMODRAFT_113974 [Selaginella moellendorffii]
MRASSGAALKESEVSRYARLLQECCSRRNVSEGRRLHDDLRRSGYGDSSYLRRCVVQMYAKCGCLADAKAAFDEIADKNDFVWNLMISGYARSGKNREALELFHKMDIPPNGFIFASALAACAGLGDLEQGREIHKRVLESPSIASDVVVQNSLVTMYARCGSVLEGIKIFDAMPRKNLVSWNAMISAFVQCDYPEQALELYHRMKRERLEPNGFVFASLLTACASLGNLELGSSIHQRITSLGLQRDIVMENALINMYSKCGCMDEALEVFSGLATRDVFTWTSMIAGYAQLGFGSEAFAFYDGMRRDCVSPTSATFVALLSACSTLEQGKHLHEEVKAFGFESITVVETALMFMYSRCGSLEDAEFLFAKMQQKDYVSWSAMVTSHAQFGDPGKALTLFRQMILEGMQLSLPTFCSALQACSLKRDSRLSKTIRELIDWSGIDKMDSIRADLVSAYSKCGDMEEARKIFDRMESRDVLTWTVMIKGYAQQGDSKAALELFHRMKPEGVEPDSVTFSSVLQACSNLEDGREVHARILAAQGGKMSDFLGNGLINMYARCGSMRDARQIFESMDRSSRISWSAIMTLCARHGQHDDIIDTYRLMVNEGVVPDGVTLIAILNSCSHAGLTDEACHYFTWIISDFELPHLDEHYQCMVDLLCRAGRLDEAEELISMIDRPDVVTLNTMLAACKNQQDLHRGARTAAQMQSTESCAAPFVLLSQIYAGEHHNTPVPG